MRKKNIEFAFQAAGPRKNCSTVHDEMAKSNGDRQHSQKRTIAGAELAQHKLLE